LRIGEREGAKLPKIYYVNWFRTEENGKFLWPGYGENSRVLKWVFERCEGTAHAADTPIGRLPRPADLDTSGLDITTQQLNELLSVDVDGWLAEIPLIREHFDRFGAHLPEGLSHELDDLDRRLRLSITKTGKLSRFGRVSQLGKRTERWPEDE
ncbi:MAG: phosphoenolpyruvate carboxykinase domain-containing protein, partial [Terriglobales bacterium]